MYLVIMADNNDNNNNDKEDKQRKRLEAKREYNRILSAAKRQQTKDQIATLTAKAEFHSDRANKLEKKNAELLQKIQVLTVANQNLRERIQQLTTSISYTGPTTSTAQNSSIGSELTATTATFGTTTAGGPPPPLLSTTFDPTRYNLHLAAATGFLSDGAARSSNSSSSSRGGDAGDLMFGGSMSTRWASALPPHWREHRPLLLDHRLLAASSLLPPNGTNNIQQRPLTQQELDLWIHLSSSTPMHPLTSNSLFMMRVPPPRDDRISNVVTASEIPVVSTGTATAASTAGDASSLLARRLVTTAEMEQGSGGGPSSTTSK